MTTTHAPSTTAPKIAPTVMPAMAPGLIECVLAVKVEVGLRTENCGSGLETGVCGCRGGDEDGEVSVLVSNVDGYSCGANDVNAGSAMLVSVSRLKDMVLMSIVLRIEVG
jgi:hypothetical protein